MTFKLTAMPTRETVLSHTQNQSLQLVSQASLSQNWRRWCHSPSAPAGHWFLNADSVSDRHRDENLDQLLDTAKVLVWEADPESWQFTYVSPQAMKLVGYSIEQWYEPDFLATHIHHDDRERFFSFCLKQAQASERYDFEFRMVARDQHIVWLHNLVNVTYGNHDPTQMRGFMIDVTDQRCAEETLRDLGGRLIAAQEEERSRLARELHDDVNQRMALLSIELEQLQQDTPKPVDLPRRLQNLQTQVSEISADIHQLSYKLHPSKLDHLGLPAALNSLCQELSNRGKLRVELHQTEIPEDLPKDITLCLFRIAQEGLRNCIKHSGAGTVQVRLEKTDRALRLSVSDDGCGFDMESGALKKGLGFISMTERLRIVAGEFRVYSRPFAGTLIEVSVPLKHQAKV